MRKIYVHCIKCGKGFAFTLPRPGQEPMRVTNGACWDGIQYRKNRTIKCDDCRKKKEKVKPRYLQN